MASPFILTTGVVYVRGLSDGTASNPSLPFFSQPTTGFYVPAGGFVGMSISGNGRFLWGGSEYRIGSGVSIGWSQNADPTLAAADAMLARDGAGIIATKNGATAQSFRIYGTTTGPKYLSLSHDGTNAVIDVSATSGLLSIAPTNATSITLGKKITSYNGVAAAGNGVATIVAAGRQTAQVGAVGSVATFTPAADGTFEVSANVLITTATNHTFTVTVTYTDEGNTARTVTMTFRLVASPTTLTTSIVNANGAVPYQGDILHIRAKAATSITIATTGTFTTVTYNVEGLIKQTA